MMLIFFVLYRIAVFLARMVMPRSRSRSLLSMMRSSVTWLSRKTWAEREAHQQKA